MNRTQPFYWFLLTVALLLGAAFSSHSHAERLTYSVGVLNQQSVVATAELWNPILHYLGKKTGATFNLAISNTVQETDARMAQGEFDLNFTNHIFYMPNQHEYRPVVQWGGEVLRGTLVSLKPETIHTLDGKTIAFPSPDAFAATVIPWTKLRQEKIRFKPLFTGSQEACMAAVAKGLADVASVTPRFAMPYANAHHMKLHIIYESEDFPQIPLLVHNKRVSAELAQQISATLLAMPIDPDGKKLLDRLNIPPFKSADNSMYTSTRKRYAEWQTSNKGMHGQ